MSKLDTLKYASEDEQAALTRGAGKAAAKYEPGSQQQKDLVNVQASKSVDKQGRMSREDYNDAVKTVQKHDPSFTPAMPSYKSGTDRVPATGPAMLHKGEAVLKKEDADKLRSAKGNMKKDVYDHVAAAMGGGREPEKPAKELDHIRTRKVKNSKGGHSYIHEHHYTHPEHYKPEEHASNDQDAMVDHMLTHMGEANPGEAEADAGQSGIGSEPPSSVEAGAQ